MLELLATASSRGVVRNYRNNGITDPTVARPRILPLSRRCKQGEAHGFLQREENFRPGRAGGG
jgi:hypothetical protein